MLDLFQVSTITIHLVLHQVALVLVVVHLGLVVVPAQAARVQVHALVQVRLAQVVPLVLLMDVQKLKLSKCNICF